MADAVSAAEWSVRLNPYHDASHYLLGNGYTRKNYTQLATYSSSNTSVATCPTAEKPLRKCRHTEHLVDPYLGSWRRRRLNLTGAVNLRGL
jgi:hypothetical protein